MKIKIVRTYRTVNWGDDKEIRYNVYHGHYRIPFLPFGTEWVLIKSSLTEDELVQYMRPLLLFSGSLDITINPI
jgi:hypothetical protein